MTRSAGAQPKSSVTSGVFLRYLGSDRTAVLVASNARLRGDLPVVFVGDQALGALQAPDYTLIDSTLALAEGAGHTPVPPPAPGLAYSGFTPHQRAAFRDWATRPEQPAPQAFQQLLLANAEVRLLEGGAKADAAYLALKLLTAAEPWRGHQGLARVLLLASWLRQDGEQFPQWSTALQLPAALWSTVLGCQALLGLPLQPEQLQAAATAWNLASTGAQQPNPAVLRLRLDSLQTVLGAEVLAFVLAKSGDAARVARPWRCQHRDLRLAFPQPDLRPLLEPLLADLLRVEEVAEGPVQTAPASRETAPASSDAAPAEAEDQAAAPLKRGSKAKQESSKPASELEKAHIIVEFGASRSDVFAYVLRHAQKQTGFQQIMDENRHIVYRVPFRRSEMRRFWHLWDYLQGWTSTRVYCEGKQLEKWQIYPYSQYLR